MFTVYTVPCLSFMITLASSARILLVAPTFHINSHTLEIVAVGEEMVSRGHEVYMVTAEEEAGREQIKQQKKTSAIVELLYKRKYVEDVSWPDIERKLMHIMVNGAMSDLGALRKLFSLISNLMHNECKSALENTELLNKLRSLIFDLAVVNRFAPTYCLFLLPHHLQIPYVSVGSLLETFLSASPTLPSFTPNLFMELTEEMNFRERVYNFLFYTVTGILNNLEPSFLVDHELLHQYAPDASSYKELMDHSQLFFVTRDHLLEWPIPVFPNVIFLPPLNCKPAKPLPNELNEIAAAAKNGIIIVSFGSFSSYQPPETANKMLAAFRQLKQTVIWRATFDGDDEIPANVHVLSWLPQNDLLGHENTVLFITHSGNNGQYEAVYHGVPMIAFALQPEQYHNAHRIFAHGFGLPLNITEFTAEQLLNAIRDVINNKTYSDNVKKTSAILRDNPMTPRQTVAYWIEHVIKFGSDHLRSHAQNLAWYEYFMVDVLLFLSILLIVLMSIMNLVLKYCLIWTRRLIFRNKFDVKKKMK